MQKVFPDNQRFDVSEPIRQQAPIGIRGKRTRKVGCIEGVMHYSCRLCNELRPVTEFYVNNKAGECGAPVRAYCKTHERQLQRVYAEKSNTYKQRKQLSKVKRREKLVAQDDQARLASRKQRTFKLPESVIQRMKDEVAHEDHPCKELALKLGIGEEVIRKVIRSSKPRDTVSKENAEKIFMYFEEHDLMEELYPVKRDIQWSRKYECCIQCGTQRVLHSGKGLCSTCRSRRDKKIPPRLAPEQWSTYFTKCQNCQRTDRKHTARGLCSSCYQWIRKHPELLNKYTALKHNTEAKRAIAEAAEPHQAEQHNHSANEENRYSTE